MILIYWHLRVLSPWKQKKPAWPGQLYLWEIQIFLNLNLLLLWSRREGPESAITPVLEEPTCGGGSSSLAVTWRWRPLCYNILLNLQQINRPMQPTVLTHLPCTCCHVGPFSQWFLNPAVCCGILLSWLGSKWSGISAGQTRQSSP